MHIQHFIFLVTVSIAHVTASNVTLDQWCRAQVVSANADSNISAYYDETCIGDPNGVGCVDQGCRFCRGINASVQLMSYNLCPENEDAPACVVSDGDSKEGISAYWDSTCPGGNTPAGGLGCQNEQKNCRLCKKWSTERSKTYLDCPSTGASPSTTSVTPTPASTPAPAPTIASACAAAIAVSGYTAVDFVVESRCNTDKPKGFGCVPKTSCQLCRTGKNVGNARLVSCKILQDMKQKTESTIANLEAVTKVDNYADGPTSTTSNTSNATVIVTTSIGSVAVMLAIVAILKSQKTKKLRNIDTPKTPLDGALISFDTCVPHL